MLKKILQSTTKLVSPPLALICKITPNTITHTVWDISSIFSGYSALFTRYILTKSSVKSLGNNVYIGKYVVLKNNQNLSIGENVSIHDSCYIDAYGDIIIGNNVSIAHHTSLISFNHTWSNPDKAIKYNNVEKGSIVIKDDVWIGCGVRIMPGVVINERSIIAAGTVVTKDVAYGSIVAGVPNRVIGSCL